MNNILLPLINPKLFNSIVETTTTFIRRHQTRLQTSTTHGCLYTQFIYICLCLLNDVKLNEIISLYSNKNNNHFMDIINRTSIKIAETYNNLSIYDKYEIPMKHNNVKKELIYQIGDMNELFYHGYGHDNIYIYPMCLYINNYDDPNLLTIIHYFTLLYDNNNKQMYLNSSYGDDDICVKNTTLEIDLNYLNEIFNLFLKNDKNENDKIEIYEFVSNFFLIGVDEDIINRETNNIINSKIGIMNNYFNIIQQSFQLLQNKRGGKYKKTKNLL